MERNAFTPNHDEENESAMLAKTRPLRIEWPKWKRLSALTQLQDVRLTPELTIMLRIPTTYFHPSTAAMEHSSAVRKPHSADREQVIWAT